MELTVKTREKGKKAATKDIRRAGNIPAILYSKGEKGIEIEVDGRELQKLLNKVESGTLSSKVFKLKIGKETKKAILKDIQYHVTTYRMLHLDFVELFDDLPVMIKIPIKCKNEMDCAGVKLGGVLRQTLRHVRVKTLPKNIPDVFEIDVKSMMMGQSKRLSEITIPEGVSPVESLDNIAVVIGRR